MSKELDDLIKEKGWRKGQSVKLGYDDIEEYANQKVIRELMLISDSINFRAKSESSIVNSQDEITNVKQQANE